MKEIELKNNDSGFEEVFKLNLGSYMFAPKQMIRFRMENPVTREKAIMSGVITELTFDERHGSPCPMAKVLFINTWEEGIPSGYMEIKLCPHRYYEGVPSDGEMELLREIFEGEERFLFYVDKENKKMIFPWDSVDELNNLSEE